MICSISFYLRNSVMCDGYLKKLAIVFAKKPDRNNFIKTNKNV